MGTCILRLSVGPALWQTDDWTYQCLKEAERVIELYEPSCKADPSLIQIGRGSDEKPYDFELTFPGSRESIIYASKDLNRVKGLTAVEEYRR